MVKIVVIHIPSNASTFSLTTTSMPIKKKEGCSLNMLFKTTERSLIESHQYLALLKHLLGQRKSVLPEKKIQ